ncbi:MAG: hypothetical protein ACQEQV_04730 [Fibrobacterota bacterium]
MKKVEEYYIKVGYRRTAKDIFDEVEIVTARFKRDGWDLDDAVIDNSLNFITLFFVKEIDPMRMI